MTTMKRRYPDGIVLEPVQILEKGINDGSPPTAASTSPESIDNLFITMVRSHECMLLCSRVCTISPLTPTLYKICTSISYCSASMRG